MAGVARVILNNRTLVDVTQDTVEEDKLMAGNTALGADGDVVQGGAREDRENDIVQGTLGGTYTNADLVKVGNCGLYRVTDRQGSDTSINFPNVEIVEDLAFYGNVKLVSATLSKASIIGSSAFRWCSVLSDVSLPAAKTIHISAFASCSALSTISLPEATVIGSYAFQSCTTLTSAYFSKVSKIHDSAFSNCAKLEDLELPYVCSPGAGTFYGCSKIPNWVHDSTGIYTACFQNCYALSAVDVSTTFNATRQNMFANCSSLSVFIIRKNAVVALSHTNCFGGTPFASGKAGGVLYVPSAYIASYKSATNWATILGYATNQILAIEGSPYESYFVDGTPINASQAVSASNGDYI